MPMIIMCANEPYCLNHVHKLGELCDECKRREKAQNYNEKKERINKYERRHSHEKQEEK